MKPVYHDTAGGVVIDGEGHVLVIVRDVVRSGRAVHEVRLPKGHIDAGETPEEAALREVGEESGYWSLEITADLDAARSEFEHAGKRHVRDERYFLMRLASPERAGQRVKPGSEEALFEPRWLDPAEAEAAMTYATEREFVRRARRLLDAG